MLTGDFRLLVGWLEKVFGACPELLGNGFASPCLTLASYLQYSLIQVALLLQSQASIRGIILP